MSEIPKVFKVPEVSKIPEMAKLPKVSKIPEVSEIPEVSQIPFEIQKVSGTVIRSPVSTGLFLVSYEPILRCSNCDEILDIRTFKMYQCDEYRCQKFFCYNCANNFELRCPTPSQQFHKPNLVLIHYSEPRYPCNYRSLGCQASLKLSEIGIHEETCVFVPIQMHWSG